MLTDMTASPLYCQFEGWQVKGKSVPAQDNKIGVPHPILFG